MTRSLRIGVGLFMLALLSSLAGACSRDKPTPAEQEESVSPPWFVDVTDEVGLDFVHDAGPERRYAMPQILGSGAALFDFDGDGLLDIYLVQNGGPKGLKNRLFRQLPGGKFVDVSAGSGLDVAGFGMGVAVGDVNNDGRPDVLLTQYGSIRLFLNKGGGKFVDVTKEAGLENPLWGTSACFFDYNRDGWLDLLVVNYVDYDPSWPCTSPGGERDFCAPRTFKGTASKLFRNRGPDPRAGGAAVRFEDVSVSSKLGRLAGPGLGVFCADFTGDGWPDVFVANDGEANHLWVNQRDGTFKEDALSRGLAYNGMARAEANMGIAFGDVDGDLLLDVFVTHLNTETNTLWKQGPAGIFRDWTAPAGLVRPRWRGTGFGTVLADFDNDGHLDLAVVNGAVRRGPAASPHLGPYWSPYGERNQVFANDGTGRFRDLSLSNPAFTGTTQIGRGLACGDVNNNGALGLLVTNVAGRARLYRNVAPNRGHWLSVRAVVPTSDPTRPRDAYGAEVTVRAGDRRQRRCLTPGGSYLCSNDPRVHFGLGAANQVDAIEVLWPDGKNETFEGGPADRPRLLRKGDGKPVKDRPQPRESS